MALTAAQRVVIRRALERRLALGLDVESLDGADADPSGAALKPIVVAALADLRAALVASRAAALVQIAVIDGIVL